MRDLDALPASLVNVDRDSLIKILSSEADDAKRLANTIRRRTALQRAKQQEAKERAARIDRILFFLREGVIATDMPASDIDLCRSLGERLHARGRS